MSTPHASTRMTSQVLGQPVIECQWGNRSSRVWLCLASERESAGSDDSSSPG